MESKRSVKRYSSQEGLPFVLQKMLTKLLSAELILITRWNDPTLDNQQKIFPYFEDVETGGKYCHLDRIQTLYQYSWNLEMLFKKKNQSFA